MELKITHPEDKQVFTFNVGNPDKLTTAEVTHICNEMGLIGIFVNGKIYKL